MINNLIKYLDKRHVVSNLDILLQALILTAGFLRSHCKIINPSSTIKHRIRTKSSAVLTVEVALRITVPLGSICVTSASRIRVSSARPAIFARDGPPMSISTCASGIKALSCVVSTSAKIEGTNLSL